MGCHKITYMKWLAANIENILASIIFITIGVAFWHSLGLLVVIIVGVVAIANAFFHKITMAQMEHHPDIGGTWFYEIVSWFYGLASDISSSILTSLGYDWIEFLAKLIFFGITFYVAYRFIWSISLETSKFLINLIRPNKKSYLLKTRKKIVAENGIIGFFEYSFVWRSLCIFFMWWESISHIINSFFKQDGSEKFLSFGSIIFSIKFNDLITAPAIGLTLGYVTYFIIGNIFIVSSRNIAKIMACIAILYYQYPLKETLDVHLPDWVFNSIQSIAAVGMIYFISNLVILAAAPILSYFFIFPLKILRDFSTSKKSLFTQGRIDHAVKLIQDHCQKENAFYSDYFQTYFVIIFLSAIERIAFNSSYLSLSIAGLFVTIDFLNYLIMRYYFSGYVLLDEHNGSRKYINSYFRWILKKSDKPKKYNLIWLSHIRRKYIRKHMTKSLKVLRWKNIV